MNIKSKYTETIFEFNTAFCTHDKLILLDENIQSLNTNFDLFLQKFAWLIVLTQSVTGKESEADLYKGYKVYHLVRALKVDALLLTWKVSCLSVYLIASIIGADVLLLDCTLTLTHFYFFVYTDG